MANWKMQERDRTRGSRGLDHDGDFEHDSNDPNASPTTPLAFGTPGRRQSSYARSQSMNGRIQKPSFVRSQSFNGSKCVKLAHRGHHMESLQAQLLSYMKATGMDQQKVMNVLEKLKETYISRSEQHQLDHSTLKLSRPASPLSTASGNQTPVRLENAPGEASTIALLKQKFAQLERYKESIQGQQIQLYPSQNLHRQSSSQSTPGSSTPCSPRLAPNGLSYPFDEGTAAILAQQREMFSGNTGIAEETSKEAMGSRSPTYDKPNSSGVGSKSDEAANALLHYMLQPPSAFQQNLAAFQRMDLSGVISTGSGYERMSAPSTESRVEPVVAKKSKPDTIVQEKNFTTSIESAMAKFPFCPSAKVSSPKWKLPVTWGTDLSLHAPSSPASDCSGGWESEMSDVGRNVPDVQSYSSGGESSDEICTEDINDLDTSLHL